jgi:hypothetical protein
VITARRADEAVFVLGPDFVRADRPTDHQSLALLDGGELADNTDGGTGEDIEKFITPSSSDRNDPS